MIFYLSNILHSSYTHLSSFTNTFFLHICVTGHNLSSSQMFSSAFIKLNIVKQISLLNRITPKKKKVSEFKIKVIINTLILFYKKLRFLFSTESFLIFEQFQYWKFLSSFLKWRISFISTFKGIPVVIFIHSVI